MKLKEITQPKTPEQQRIDALKGNKDRAANALAIEKQRQQVSAAQKTISAAATRQIKRPAAPKPPTN